MQGGETEARQHPGTGRGDVLQGQVPKTKKEEKKGQKKKKKSTKESIQQKLHNRTALAAGLRLKKEKLKKKS